MTAQEVLREIVEQLSRDDLEKVVGFAQSLHAPQGGGEELPPPQGLWKDLGKAIGEEEIREAREEMWGTFPRDDF